MTLFLVEPRDTLVLRDGRPMATGAAVAQTLPMPWPSSVAGLARTRAGTDDRGHFDVARAKDLRQRVATKGPWLLRFGSEDSSELCFAAPADAVWFGKDKKEVHRLRPASLPPGCVTDDGACPELALLPEELREKPVSGPSFWTWKAMQAWLAKGEAIDDDAAYVAGLVRERRTHVAIDSEKLTARDGNLFSTDGLRFERRIQGRLERYGLAFDASGPDAAAIRSGLVVLGGERRPSQLRPADLRLPAPPAIDESARRLRIVLTTPAYFAEGARPHQIRGARVVAACVGRPEVISGWDFELSQPKPTRRLCPAGSVFWVELSEGRSIREYVEAVWMNSVCEDDQDQRDGLGVALVGVA